MSMSHYPFMDIGKNEEILDRHVSSYIFSFFKPHELAGLDSTCQSWAAFYQSNPFYVHQEILDKASKFAPFFHLYQHESGFILDINLAKAFNYSNQFNSRDIRGEIQSDLAFIDLSDHISPYSKRHAYFWSPDGLQFFEMQEKIFRRNSNDPSNIEVGFCTTEDDNDSNHFCMIEFDKNTALVSIQNKSDMSDSDAADYTDEDDFSDDSDSMDIDNEIIFKRCPLKMSRMLAEFIFSNKVTMQPIQYRIDHILLYKFNDNNWLYVGSENNQHVLKIRINWTWHHLSREQLAVFDLHRRNIRAILFTLEDCSYSLNTMMPASLHISNNNHANNERLVYLDRVEFTDELLEQLGLPALEKPEERPTPLDMLKSNFGLHKT